MTHIRVKAVVKSMTLQNLIEAFIFTNYINGPEVPTVRGWLMDELQARNPAAFDAWLDSDDCLDEDLPKYFLN